MNENMQNINTKKTPYDIALAQMSDESQGKIVSSPIGDVTEEIHETTKMKGGRIAKTIGLAAVTANIALGSMDVQAADNTRSIEDKSTNDIEISNETSIENTENIANPFNVDENKEGFHENLDPIEPETEPIKEILDSNIEKFEIDIMKSFKFEHAKLNPEQFSAAEAEIIKQINALPQEIKDGLESGKKFIKISVSRDAVPIVDGGYDAGRGWVNNLEDLARDTAEEIGDVAESGAKKAGLKNITIQFEIPEGGVDLDNPTRYGKISFEDVVVLGDLEIKGFDSNNLIEELPNGHLKLLLGDASDSFKGKMGQFYKLAEEKGLTDGTVDFMIASGRGQLSEKVKVASERDVGLYENNLKDKQRFSNNEDMVSNMLLAAEKMPYVKYIERIENEPGLFVTGTDEKITISKYQIERMLAEEESRDGKFVLLMENRDTGEVTVLTTEKMILLLDNYGVEKDTQKVTIDVNKEMIGGGSANIIMIKDFEDINRNIVATN